MARKTATTPSAQLGDLVGAPQRHTPRASRPSGNKVTNFKAWLDAEKTARQVVNLDATSPIAGRMDVDVLVDVKTALEQVLLDLNTLATAGPPVAPNPNTVGLVGTALELVTELQKRKAARQLAGKIYRGGK